MLTDDDKRDIERLIKKNKADNSESGCLVVLFALFVFGFFKGCGY